MKKVVLSVVAALAMVSMAAPAFAADMPVKAPAAPAAAPSPWDVLFGVDFTSDYILRGISQSNRKPAVQGYFEVDYKATDWLTLYAGVWGSSLWTSFANGEFDNSGGARFSWGKFSLDVGGVYYAYPCTGCVAVISGSSNISYAEFYAKPSYKITDWLTVGAQIYGGDNFGNSGESAWWYTGNATVTLPQFMPLGIGTSVSADIGRQTYDSTLKTVGAFVDYTTWDAGIDFNYKAITLDLRYYDTNAPSTATECNFGVANAKNPCTGAFVAMLKFDAALSGLK
jgi:uncharacterized protein (TIGR02001 family)